MEKAQLKEILQAFPTEGIYVGAVPYGKGHINDSLAVYYQLESGDSVRYLLQRINNDIFKDVEGLMNNILGITEFLGKKIEAAGGDPARETMKAVTAADGKPYYRDSTGAYWRMYRFIEDTITLQIVEKVEDMYNTGVAFGKFQKLLADYPAETLAETIPDFHNTPARYQAFLDAVKADPKGRAAGVADEIEFITSRQATTEILTNRLDSGELSLRVSHNDTKINNMLIDKRTGKGLCIVDLDTVMPGLYHYDFGDAIRFGASSAAEDETDLSKVHMRIELFDAFSKGYLEEVGCVLSELEKSLLPASARVITLECGMRFLTDYLMGDTYFRIDYPEHNLDRARTQFKLVADMEDKDDAMMDIIKKYS